MHRTIITLHEYRLRYPDSAAIPTLTQSGFLGLLLDRQRHKAANLPDAAPGGDPYTPLRAMPVSAIGILISAERIFRRIGMPA